MFPKLALTLVAFAVGGGLALQSIVNAGLARGLGSGVVAAATSFWVGALALGALALAGGGVGQSLAAGRNMGIGWWLAGGLLGASFVTSMTFVVPRLGIAVATSFAVAGQLIAAALFDHYGVLGLETQPLSWQRLAGVALLIAGALLVRFF